MNGEPAQPQRRSFQFDLRLLLAATALLALLFLSLRHFLGNESQQGWSPGFQKSAVRPPGAKPGKTKLPKEEVRYYEAAQQALATWLTEQGFTPLEGPPPELAMGPAHGENWYQSSESESLYVTVSQQNSNYSARIRADVRWYAQGWPTDIQRQRERSEEWSARLKHWWKDYSTQLHHPEPDNKPTTDHEEHH